MKKVKTLFSALILIIAVIISSGAFGQKKITIIENVPLMDAEMFKSNMRKLCEDHINWTRNVIFCVVDNLPGKEEAMKRLLMNQTDIGNAIKPYFGNEAGKELTELLKSHVLIAAEVIKDAKEGNTDALELANKRWYSNAAEISLFLRKINPNWALTQVKEMMYEHLNLTSDEANARINQKYDDDVIAYDKLQIAILEMSDMLVADIIKQFPDKFQIETCKTALK